MNAFTLCAYYVDESVPLAQAGTIYLMSAVNASQFVQLPAAGSVPAGGAIIIKRVESSGHTINVLPATGEHVNGNSGGVGLSQQGQGRWFIAGAPAGAAAGTGWTSY